MEPPPSSVCFVGVYGSNQNEVLRQGLEAHDVAVYDAGISTQDVEITLFGRSVPVYPMKPTLNWISHFPAASFPLLLLFALVFHAVLTWGRLATNVGRLRRADVLVVPHFGDTAVLLVKPVALLLGKPLVYISHNGLYCTLVENREVFGPEAVEGRIIRLLDATIQRLADRTFVFSRHSITVMSDWFGVPEERYASLYIGVAESRFSTEHPTDHTPDVDVLYWGNFIPHHGVETMVGAAAALSAYDFVFAGKSDERARVVDAADRIDSDNVRFPGFLSDAELMAYIREADLVLGPLGDYTQTRMNIGTKVAEAASLRKAIVLADHPAANEVFDDGESACLVSPEDVDALASGIETVLSDEELRNRLEDGSYGVYERYFAPERIAAQFLDGVESLTVKST